MRPRTTLTLTLLVVLASTGNFAVGDCTEQERVGGAPPSPAAGDAQASLADTYQATALVGADHYLILADQALAASDLGAAEDMLRAALLVAPTPSTYLRLINVLTAQPGRDQAVNEAWTTALGLYPNNLDILYAHAHRLLAEDNPHAAGEVYSRGLSLAPSEVRFREGYIISLLHQGKTSEAVRACSDALNANYSSRLVALLANTYRISGQPEMERGTWDNYLEHYSFEPWLLIEYGDWLVANRQGGQAGDYYSKAQQVTAGDDGLLVRIARSFKGLMLYENAVAVYRQLPPAKQPLLSVELAECYRAMGDLDQAAATLEQGLAAAPGDYRITLALSEVLLGSGQSDSAITVLQAALIKTPAGYFYLPLATMAAEIGDNALAEETYLSGLRQRPADRRLLGGYIALLLAIERTDDASRIIDLAMAQVTTGDERAFIDDLGAMLLDKGAAGEGLLGQIAAMFPDSPDSYYWLGLLLSEQGRHADAITQVKQGLIIDGGNYRLRRLELNLVLAIDGLEIALKKATRLLGHPEITEQGLTDCIGLLRQAEQTSEATTWAKIGMARFPGSVDVIEPYAALLFEASDHAGVIALLSDPMVATLGFAAKDEMLGRCYLSEGNYLLAIAYLKAACAASQTTEGGLHDINLLALLGEAQFFASDLVAARSSLSRAAAMDDGLATAHLWLGFVLLALDDTKGATIAFETARSTQSPEDGIQDWLAIGAAKIAFAQSDAAVAQQLLDVIAAITDPDPRLEAMAAELRAKLTGEAMPSSERSGPTLK